MFQGSKRWLAKKLGVTFFSNTVTHWKLVLKGQVQNWKTIWILLRVSCSRSFTQKHISVPFRENGGSILYWKCIVLWRISIWSLYHSQTRRFISFRIFNCIGKFSCWADFAKHADSSVKKTLWWPYQCAISLFPQLSRTPPERNFCLHGDYQGDRMATSWRILLLGDLTPSLLSDVKHQILSVYIANKT